MTPQGTKVGSPPGTVPHSDLYQKYGVRFLSLDESLPKDAIESEPPATQPTTAERPIRGRLRRLELLVATCIACFAYFAWRTHAQERVFEQTAHQQDEALSKLADAISGQDKQVTDMSKSVENATKSLAVQVGELTGNLETRRNQMDTIQSRLQGLEVTLRNQQRTAVVQPPPVQSERTALAAVAPTSWAASPQHPHDHQFDTSIAMPAGALAHQSHGAVDYWMVPRMFISGERVVKVLPFGVNSIGVKVHNIEDGMDYILLPTGQWTAALEPQ